MYPVTQDFLDKIKAEKRQVSAKAEISYTDPFIDQSINIAVSEKANVSYEQQTADAVDTMPYKWASLDGSWKLDGSYHLAPVPELLSQYQFGWWGSQLSGSDGTFVSPYPTLTVTHFARPIRTLTVVGDSARGEYPVDFQIDLYASDNTLLYSKAVIGNTLVNWSYVLPSQVLDVVKQVLTITKWNMANRQVKITEFFTSIQETYYNDDIVKIDLLEEREASQGSLPVGNITSNEVTLTLVNKDKKFNVDNTQSPLNNLLKPNRKIKLWLGAEAENLATDKPPTFTRSSVAYLSDGTQVAANVPRFEPGKFGKAIMLEEGTTNLFTNPLLTTDSNADGVADGYTKQVDHTITATYSISNGQRIAITASTGTGNNNGAGIVTSSYIPVSAGQSITASVYANILSRSGTTWITFFFYWYDSSYTQISTIAFSASTTAIGQQRIISSAQTVPTNAAYVKVNCQNRVLDNGSLQDVVFTRLQLEARPYATSFIDGTRAAETLTIPTAGVLNPQEGTISVWVYVNDIAKRQESGKYNRMIIIPPASGDWWKGIEIQHPPEPYWRFYVGDGSTNTYVSISDSYTPNGWHYFVIVWTPLAAKIYIDGILRGTINNPPLPSSFASYCYIGQYNGAVYLNTLFDDLRISSRARTDEEIAAAYASGQPLPVDADTTYKLTFNGSIYPVEKVWIPLGTFWSLDWDSPDDTLEATVTARDRMELLRKGTYQSSQVQTNVSLYTLAEQVLQDAGLKTTEYSIDTALQSIVVPYAWFNPTSHREALRIIAEAALAVVYAGRDGIIRIQSFNSGLGTTAIEITEDEYFLPLRNPSQQSQVANQVIVTTQPLKPASTAQEVYRSNNPISVSAGQTVTVTANYNQPPVIEAVASLDSPPTGVSIISAAYYGWGAKVSIQNTSGSAANVTLVINGKPLTVQNKETAMAQDNTSITENGVLRYEFPENPLVQTLTQAQNIANTLLASVKDPRRDLEMDWRGNPALLLGDKITVKGQDYHVIRQEIEWAGYLSAKLNGRKAI